MFYDDASAKDVVSNTNLFYITIFTPPPAGVIYGGAPISVIP